MRKLEGETIWSRWTGESATYCSRWGCYGCKVDHGINAPIPRVHFAQEPDDLAVVFQVALQVLCLDGRFGRRGRDGVNCGQTICGIQS
jgi:hypothetical protein